MTLAKFGETYFERLGRPVSANTRVCFAQLVAFTANDMRLGEKALTAITEDDLEAFLAKVRADGKAASTRNTYVQTTKALFRWAVKKGYLTRNPAGDSEALKREQHVRRDRRPGWHSGARQDRKDFEADLHNVAHMLGHANFAQTSTYLNATRVGLQDAMRRLDASRGKFVASAGEIESAPHSHEATRETSQELVNSEVSNTLSP